MREIKFRFGFNVVNEVVFMFMTLSELLDCNFALDGMITKINENRNFGLFQPASEEYIEFELTSKDQFTGLQDKNGVDVYEGDILAYGENVPERAVIFENGSFRLSDDTNQADQALVIDTAKRLLIIGNIHQKPELLKKATS